MPGEHINPRLAHPWAIACGLTSVPTCILSPVFLVYGFVARFKSTFRYRRSPFGLCLHPQIHFAERSTFLFMAALSSAVLSALINSWAAVLLNGPRWSESIATCVELPCSVSIWPSGWKVVLP